MPLVTAFEKEAAPEIAAWMAACGKQPVPSDHWMIQSTGKEGDRIDASVAR